MNKSNELKPTSNKVFAQGLCFDKLVWVFIISCLVGYGVEEIWCFIRHGYFESRQALVYGPLSVVYGMGAVILTLSLYKFADKNLFQIFIIAYLVGTATEYIASLGQEVVFGSVAWDYSSVPLNINGRVCLPYSVFWGILGIGWIKCIYPVMSKCIEKIPYKLGKTLTFLFLVFFVYDCAMSALAGLRMNQRAENIPADNFISQYFDKHFPDERMHRIYANSKPVKK